RGCDFKRWCNRLQVSGRIEIHDGIPPRNVAHVPNSHRHRYTRVHLERLSAHVGWQAYIYSK
ncbi:unnamed protein product, partial [Aphanomyces euteiches]